MVILMHEIDYLCGRNGVSESDGIFPASTEIGSNTNHHTSVSGHDVAGHKTVNHYLSLCLLSFGHCVAFHFFY
jgi:hypothetical protein